MWHNEFLPTYLKIYNDALYWLLQLNTLYVTFKVQRLIPKQSPNRLKLPFVEPFLLLSYKCMTACGSHNLVFLTFLIKDLGKPGLPEFSRQTKPGLQNTQKEKVYIAKLVLLCIDLRQDLVFILKTNILWSPKYSFYIFYIIITRSSLNQLA